MKTIVALICCIGTIAADSPDVARKAMVREYFAHLKTNPNLRIVQGNVFDLTLVLDSNEWALRHTPATIIRGKVLQIAGGGVYVQPYSDKDARLFLTNCPNKKELVDGEHVQYLAFPIGAHQYKSVIGATQTVKAYDCGAPFHPTETPEVIYRMTQNGAVKLERKMGD